MGAPTELIKKWVSFFNNQDYEGLASLYHENATNHQINSEPVTTRKGIKEMFKNEFENAEMVCLVENIFEDGEWGIMEWKDPLGLRGCGFFQVKDNQIVFQRGYWDKLSFLRIHNLPVPSE